MEIFSQKPDEYNKTQPHIEHEVLSYPDRQQTINSTKNTSKILITRNMNMNKKYNNYVLYIKCINIQLLEKIENIREKCVDRRDSEYKINRIMLSSLYHNKFHSHYIKRITPMDYFKFNREFRR